MPRVELRGIETSGPVWAGDYMHREHVMPGGAMLDAAQFLATDSVVVTANGAAAQAATSITVDALTGPIPNGTVLVFGTGEFAKLTAAAAAGATSLTVEALVNGIEDDDAATYTGTALRTVVSGTPIGRTFAERDSATGFGPAASTDDEIFLVAYDVLDVTQDNGVDLYRPGSLVYENFLPGWATMATALKTKLRAVYQTAKGVA